MTSPNGLVRPCENVNVTTYRTSASIANTRLLNPEPFVAFVNPATLFWSSLSALAVACFAATGVHAFRDFSRAHLKELLRKRQLLPRFDEIVEHHRQAALGAESLRVFATAAAVFAAAAFLWNTQNSQADWPLALALTVG